MTLKCFAKVAFILFSIGFAIDRYAYRLQDTSFEEDFYKMGLWAQEHPSEKIAMFSSGIVSFMAPSVVNLDGKVNADALRAHEQGRLVEYLREQHFTYIADWKDILDDFAASARKKGLVFDSTGRIEHIQLMKRRGNVN